MDTLEGEVAGKNQTPPDRRLDMEQIDPNLKPSNLARLTAQGGHFGSAQF